MGNRITEFESAQLRQGIVDSGMSITSLARAAGIPQPVLHRFVHNERTLYRETAEKVAQVLGMDFFPTLIDEVVCAAHDFALQSLLEAERSAFDMAKSLRATEQKLLNAGLLREAKACSNAAYAQERIAARSREYVDERLKPVRAQVEKELMEAKPKAAKRGRSRRSSSVKKIEIN